MQGGGILSYYADGFRSDEKEIASFEGIGNVKRVDTIGRPSMSDTLRKTSRKGEEKLRK